MRKIASNYILLPGSPLVKNGYVVLDAICMTEVVNTGGVIREIQGLEFYGGMIVSACLTAGDVHFPVGVDMVEWLTEYYKTSTSTGEGVALIKGADLQQLRFTENTTIERLA